MNDSQKFSSSYPLSVPSEPDYFLDWEAINRYAWVQELKDCPQEPTYHAEGDVWIHTRMVLEALIAMKSWRELEEQERTELFWAALMHDIAKPMCTQIEPDGRISSPKHALRGEQLARQLMWKGLPPTVPFGARERIAKLVRYHGLPLWFMEKREPEKALIQASLHISLHQLAMLAEADMRGRICEDQAEFLDRIELFRLQAQEIGCYEQPYFFESELARFTYFYKENSPLSYVPYDDYVNEVILLCGLPGAGKNHWIQHEGPGWSVISLDAIREELGIGPRDNQGKVLQLAKERAKAFLRRQEPFIWNATNINKNRRKGLIDLFTTYKARTRIVYIEPAYEQLFLQNKAREKQVAENVLKRFIQRLDMPGVEEAFGVSFWVSASWFGKQ